LILSDDHSVPHLGCYGGPNAITPRLDAFAAEGMRFARAYTASPQCAPSRASIFFGQSPVALRVTRFTQPALASNRAVSDILREAGYWVGLDGRHHHLDGKRKEAAHVLEALESEGLKYLEERFDHVRVLSTRGAENLAAIPGRVNEVLDQVPDSAPFFLYFGFSQPHRPWDQARHPQRFDPAKLVLPPDFPDLPEVRRDYASFHASLCDLDYGFGLLMDTLEDRGLSDNTIVVFVGDNGDSLLRGKGTLHERGLHVPLIVRWPGVVEPGSVSGALVGAEDIAGTLLEALGLPVPEEMGSVSFLPALKGRDYEEREYVYGERGWHYGPITRTDGLDLSRSISDRRYRFLYNVLPERRFVPVDMVDKDSWAAIVEAHQKGELSELHERLYFPERRPVFELYDLERDPYEFDNLSGKSEYEDVEKRLREALAQWMVRESDYLPLPSLSYPVDTSSPGSFETLESGPTSAASND